MNQIARCDWLHVLAQLAFFPSVISSFLPKIKGLGGAGPPRSDTENCPCEIEVPYLILSNTRTMSFKYFKGFIEGLALCKFTHCEDDFSHLV